MVRTIFRPASSDQSGPPPEQFPKKILNKEITVANKFIFYYANFVEKIYGYVLRRDGSNIPEEHYVGRLRETVPRRKGRSKIPTRPLGAPEFHKQGDPLQPDISKRDRWSGSPEIGEIVLCLFRKHLLVGCLVEARRNGKLVLVTEDQRNIVVRRNAIV